MNSKIIIAIFNVVLMVACTKTKLPYTNVVFLVAASTSPFVNLIVDTSGGSYAIKASSADIVEEAVTLQIEVDTSLVSDYNKLYNKSYKPLPNFYFDYSYNGRYLDGAISEARIWNKALSLPEITNGMCGVDPANAGLLAYWKIKES